MGAYALGIVALAWTIDAFYALYLTMPTTAAAFLGDCALDWTSCHASGHNDINM